MRKRSTLFSLLLASIVGISGFSQDATYSKMSPHTRILLDQLERNDTIHSSLRGAVEDEYLFRFRESRDRGSLGGGGSRRLPDPDPYGGYRYGIDPAVAGGDALGVG